LNRLKNSFRKQNAYRIAYISIGVLFLFWILFLDSHSWLTHIELNTEIETLQQRKKNLQKSIAKDQKAIEQLNNLDSLEKYAREQYGHKKEGETIFIIEK
jgi:cell division protein DivIC